MRAVIATVILILMCLLFAWNGYAADTDPTIAKIHSMDNCPPCEALVAQVQADGGKVSAPAPTEIQHSTSYPTVIYSDGTWDNGKRVYHKQYAVREKFTIPLTKLVQK